MENLKNINEALTIICYELNLLNELKSKDQENYSYDDEIIISDPDNLNFNACIRVKNDRARLSFSANKTIYLKSAYKKYSDGDPHTVSYSFDYVRFLTSEESKQILTDLGLPDSYDNFKNLIYNLSREFKATKNKKLILNDIKKSFEVYKKIIDLVTPRIEQKIEEDKKIVILQNKINQLTTYAHNCHNVDIPTDQKYYLNINNHSTCILDFRCYGSADLSVRLSYEDLESLINNKELILKLTKEK